MGLIQDYLKKYSPLIVDGALGTELEERGYNLNDRIWSAKLLAQDPKVIGEVLYDYLKAGADFIITATYQASYEGFFDMGMSEKEAKELIVSAIDIAKEVRDRFLDEYKIENLSRPKPLVAASIGPYGAFLADGSEFLGDYKIGFDELKEFHYKRLKTIINSKPDILAIETIPCLNEAKAIIELLDEFDKIQVWVSFSAKDGYHINSGEKITKCAKWLEDIKEVSAVGVNCTNPEFVESLIKEIVLVSSKPVIVYPNKGGEYDNCTKIWKSDDTLPSFESMAETWFKAGASLIGGCCKTTPHDIETIAKRLR